MKRSSIKKLSILSLVLIGASAVTAAVLPKSDSKDDLSGQLVVTSDNGVGQDLAVGDNTCIPNGTACDPNTATATSTVGGIKAGTSTSNFNATASDLKDTTT
jgi:hypothetical protein